MASDVFPMTKHREWRQVPGGGSGAYWENRVIELAGSKKPQPPAEPVEGATPEHDWQAAGGPPPREIR